MKKLFMLFICLCAIGIQKSFSQPQKKVDSLFAVLKTTKEDTIRLNVLEPLSWQLVLVSKYKEAIQYALQMKALSEKLITETSNAKLLSVLKKKVAIAYRTIGEANRSQGDYSEGLKNLAVAKELFEQMRDTANLASTYYTIGAIHTWQGNYADGLSNITMAKKFYAATGNTKGVGTASSIIGTINNQQGNYPEALKNYLISLKIDEEEGDKSGLGSDYLNIGIVYYRQDNDSEALKNINASLKFSKEMSNKSDMGLGYYYLAAVYSGEKKYEEALANLLECKKICEEIGDKGNLAFAYTATAGIFMAQKKYDEALKNNFAGLKIMQEISDQYGTGNTLNSIAEIYLAQKKFSEAIQFYTKGLEVAKKVSDKEGIMNSYEGLADVCKEKNDYKKAYEFSTKSSEMDDSIFNESKSKQIAELKTKYETEKKDAEIILLNKDQELKDSEIRKQKTLKYSFVSGLAAILILSLVVFNNFRVRSKLKLQTLRNKIASDLHDDVGSTLSSIAIFSEVAQQQSKEVIPMLNTIGESARKMLDAMADIVWTINPENDNFEKIILRMRSFAYQLLGAKKIEFEFEADDEVGKKKLPMDVRKNLYLIFKEATNNMVKYSQANKASFSVKSGKNELTLLIRDNGKGFDTARQTIGNGLKNMKKRAEEIRANLLIESHLDSGTTIQLTLAVA